MKISTRGRYALRILIDLAENSKEKYVSIHEIAIRQDISNKYLEQIMSMLNKAGYLEVARGNNGGYKLAKKLEEYKIGDILRVTEGDLKPILCLKEDSSCARKDSCKTYAFWQGLDDVITEYVDSKTLKDLI